MEVNLSTAFDYWVNPSNEKPRRIPRRLTLPTLTPDEIVQSAKETGLCGVCRAAIQSYCVGETLPHSLLRWIPTGAKSVRGFKSFRYNNGPRDLEYLSPLPHVRVLEHFCIICRQVKHRNSDWTRDDTWQLTISFWIWGRPDEDKRRNVMFFMTLPGSQGFGVEVVKILNIPHSLKSSSPDFSAENATSGSRTAQKLAVGWLHRCQRLSNRPIRIDRWYKPTRLLDARTARKTGFLKLVTTTKRTIPTVEDSYITLSYCWGEKGATDSPLLLTRNLHHRLHVGLRILKLPKTFQEAIEVCHWFGGM